MFFPHTRRFVHDYFCSVSPAFHTVIQDHPVFVFFLFLRFFFVFLENIFHCTGPKIGHLLWVHICRSWKTWIWISCTAPRNATAARQRAKRVHRAARVCRSRTTRSLTCRCFLSPNKSQIISKINPQLFGWFLMVSEQKTCGNQVPIIYFFGRPMERSPLAS